MAADGVILRWRPMTTVGIVIVVSGLSGVMLGIIGPKPDPSFADHAFTAGLSAIIVAVGLRGALTKLVLTPTQVVVHNWVRTGHLGWGEIDAITVDPRKGIRIRCHDGRIVKVENPAPSTGNIVTGRGKRFGRYESAIRSAERAASE